MVTGFDYLSKDKDLQAHWLRRFVAIVIDAIIIYIPVNLFINIVGWGHLFSVLPFLGTWLIFFLYCTLLDLVVGGTFGKMLMRLKVVAISGKLDLAQALMRNISKIFPIFLILDWVIGMALDTNDPRQKWTDQLAKTSVILH